MKLEFNSVDELQDFLNFAFVVGARRSALHAAAPMDLRECEPAGGHSGSVGGHSTFTAGDGSPADLEAKDLQIGPYDPEFMAKVSFAECRAVLDARTPPPVIGGSTGATSQPAEPAKRKRRTKAEIEADAAAIAATAHANAIADANRATYGEEAKTAMQASETETTSDAPSGGEAALEAARAVLRDKAQPPAGANPFDQVHTAPVTDGSTTNDEGSAQAVDTAVTPFQHLTRARDFIAKHGMAKYNESFTAAELDANVMGYTDEQRAQHMAALAALERA